MGGCCGKAAAAKTGQWEKAEVQTPVATTTELLLAKGPRVKRFAYLNKKANAHFKAHHALVKTKTLGACLKADAEAGSNPQTLSPVAPGSRAPVKKHKLAANVVPYDFKRHSASCTKSYDPAKASSIYITNTSRQTPHDDLPHPLDEPSIYPSANLRTPLLRRHSGGHKATTESTQPGQEDKSPSSSGPPPKAGSNSNFELNSDSTAEPDNKPNPDNSE